jgi:hypothetical protein
MHYSNIDDIKDTSQYRLPTIPYHMFQVTAHKEDVSSFNSTTAIPLTIATTLVSSWHCLYMEITSNLMEQLLSKCMLSDQDGQPLAGSPCPPLAN